jgi:predicted amidohydrolase YtcJ
VRLCRCSRIPWVALEWLVRGRTIGGLQLYRPGNLVDRDTALAMYTTAGAELTGKADAKGILAEGYLADLAVLSEDYFDGMGWLRQCAGPVSAVTA